MIKIEHNAKSRERSETISKDELWRSFPKIPCLLQYVSNGNYYGRIRVKGKLIRVSLKTTIWSTAKLRLADLHKFERENSTKISVPGFSEAVEIFKRELELNPLLKPKSKKYRLWCLGKIHKTWPELWNLRLNQISAESCKEWSSKLVKEVACHYYNNTLGTLKQVIQVGLKAHQASGGEILKNPTAELKKTRITCKNLKLPEPAQFKDLVANIRKRSGGWGPRDADLVEFLAYSGLRINSEAAWVTAEDVDWKRGEIIVRGDPITATKNSETRRVPILPDMKILLLRITEEYDLCGQKPVLQVGNCSEALARACKELGIAKLTHHDLRHLFATRCIESGVDIPTVSRWLGHKDGGALAMKTYGHLRNEHSQAMAQKVSFSPLPTSE